jgi:hypothetical protein
MKNIGNFIGLSLAKAGVKRRLEAAMILQEVNEWLERIWCDPSNSPAKALSLVNGSLNIACRNKIIAGEIFYHRMDLIRTVRENSGNKINKIVFKPYATLKGREDYES